VIKSVFFQILPFIQLIRRTYEVVVIQISDRSICIFYFNVDFHCQSQWTRGLSSGSAAVSLLGLRFGMPPGDECLYLVSVVCCQVDVSTSG
jgi:hypothetical protein